MVGEEDKAPEREPVGVFTGLPPYGSALVDEVPNMGAKVPVVGRAEAEARQNRRVAYWTVVLPRLLELTKGHPLGFVKFSKSGGWFGEDKDGKKIPFPVRNIKGIPIVINGSTEIVDMMKRKGKFSKGPYDKGLVTLFYIPNVTGKDLRYVLYDFDIEDTPEEEVRPKVLAVMDEMVYKGFVCLPVFTGSSWHLWCKDPEDGVVGDYGGINEDVGIVGEIIKPVCLKLGLPMRGSLGHVPGQTTIDYQVNKANSPVRVPLSLHHKTGLVALPLTRDEVLKLNKGIDAHPDIVLKNLEKYCKRLSDFFTFNKYLDGKVVSAPEEYKDPFDSVCAKRGYHDYKGEEEGYKCKTCGKWYGGIVPPSAKTPMMAPNPLPEKAWDGLSLPEREKVARRVITRFRGSSKWEFPTKLVATIAEDSWDDLTNDLHHMLDETYGELWNSKGIVPEYWTPMRAPKGIPVDLSIGDEAVTEFGSVGTFVRHEPRPGDYYIIKGTHWKSIVSGVNGESKTERTHKTYQEARQRVLSERKNIPDWTPVEKGATLVGITPSEHTWWWEVAYSRDNKDAWSSKSSYWVIVDSKATPMGAPQAETEDEEKGIVEEFSAMSVSKPGLGILGKLRETVLGGWGTYVDGVPEKGDWFILKEDDDTPKWSIISGRFGNPVPRRVARVKHDTYRDAQMRIYRERGKVPLFSRGQTAIKEGVVWWWEVTKDKRDRYHWAVVYLTLPKTPMKAPDAEKKSIMPTVLGGIGIVPDSAMQSDDFGISKGDDGRIRSWVIGDAHSDRIHNTYQEAIQRVLHDADSKGAKYADGIWWWEWADIGKFGPQDGHWVKVSHRWTPMLAPDAEVSGVFTTELGGVGFRKPSDKGPQVGDWGITIGRNGRVHSWVEGVDHPSYVTHETYQDAIEFVLREAREKDADKYRGGVWWWEFASGNEDVVGRHVSNTRWVRVSCDWVPKTPMLAPSNVCARCGDENCEYVEDGDAELCCCCRANDGAPPIAMCSVCRDYFDEEYEAEEEEEFVPTLAFHPRRPFHWTKWHCEDCNTYFNQFSKKFGEDHCRKCGSQNIRRWDKIGRFWAAPIELPIPKGYPFKNRYEEELCFSLFPRTAPMRGTHHLRCTGCQSGRSAYPPLAGDEPGEPFSTDDPRKMFLHYSKHHQDLKSVRVAVFWDEDEVKDVAKFWENAQDYQPHATTPMLAPELPVVEYGAMDNSSLVTWFASGHEKGTSKSMSIRNDILYSYNEPIAKRRRNLEPNPSTMFRFEVKTRSDYGSRTSNAHVSLAKYVLGKYGPIISVAPTEDWSEIRPKTPMLAPVVLPKPGMAYSNLNDASRNPAVPIVARKVLQEGNTPVWYMKDYSWNLRVMTGDLPTLNDIERDYVRIGTVSSADPSAIFRSLQAEGWSPNGEAVDLISKVGVSHTSMTVGDVIQIGKRYLVVAIRGFQDIAPPKTPMLAPTGSTYEQRGVLQNAKDLRLGDLIEDLQVGVHSDTESKSNIYGVVQEITPMNIEGLAPFWIYAVWNRTVEGALEVARDRLSIGREFFPGRFRLIFHKPLTPMLAPAGLTTGMKLKYYSLKTGMIVGTQSKVTGLARYGVVGKLGHAGNPTAVWARWEDTPFAAGEAYRKAIEQGNWHPAPGKAHGKKGPFGVMTYVDGKDREYTYMGMVSGLRPKTPMLSPRGD